MLFTGRARMSNIAIHSLSIFVETDVIYKQAHSPSSGLPSGSPVSAGLQSNSLDNAPRPLAVEIKKLGMRNIEVETSSGQESFRPPQLLA